MDTSSERIDGRLLALAWTVAAVVITASATFGAAVSASRAAEPGPSAVAVALPILAPVLASLVWVLDAFAAGRVLSVPMPGRRSEDAPRVMRLRTMAQICNLVLVPLWTAMAVTLT